MSEDLTTCTELRPLLRDAARGWLDQSPATAVTAHLGTCAVCRAISDEERALDQLLEEKLPQHPASLARSIFGTRRAWRGAQPHRDRLEARGKDHDRTDGTIVWPYDDGGGSKRALRAVRRARSR